MHLVSQPIEQIAFASNRSAERPAQRKGLDEWQRSGHGLGAQFVDTEGDGAFGADDESDGDQDLGNVTRSFPVVGSQLGIVVVDEPHLSRRCR